MSANNGKVNEEMAKEAQENLQDLGRTLTENANKLRLGIVDQLKEAMGAIQKEMDDNSGTWDVEARERTKDVMNKLEVAAEYLEEHSVEDLEAEAKEVVTENVWVSLVIAFLVGLVLGWLLSRD